MIAVDGARFGVSVRACLEELAPLAECAKIENKFVLRMMSIGLNWSITPFVQIKIYHVSHM
jgi:hypothetical protein